MTIQRSPLQYTQRQRKNYIILTALVALPFIGGNDNYWGADMQYLFYMMSALAILTMAFGRLWSVWYIAGYKKAKLITVGPYSLNRNPLYHFSLIGVFGVGLLSGSFIIASLICAAIFSIFNWVISKEEVFLQNEFGDDYSQYCASTPRWGMRLGNYTPIKNYASAGVAPKIMWRTARESLLLLGLIPLHWWLVSQFPFYFVSIA